MKHKLWIGVIIIFAFASLCFASPFDDFLKGVKKLSGKSAPDEATTVAGLKEALTIGAGKAVTSVSKLDGYLGNQAIKILLPEKLKTVETLLRTIGYQKQVDEFVLSMNRAAEKAAPQARNIFVQAIRQMNFDDAKKVLTGGNTAATEYFKEKTSGLIAEAFKPTVVDSMNEVGATRAYKEMTAKYTSALPFASAKEKLDLDRYVTDKAVDGLFHMLAEEETKIRLNPAARVTDLLKTVFGK
jgi:hypothetical protein